MTIETFLDNFSDKQRVKREGETLTVTTSYKWYSDIVIAILFFMILLPGLCSYLFNNSEISFSILCLPVIFLAVILYKTRGDNKLKIDLLKRNLTVTKRSKFLFFIPKYSLHFEDIEKYEIVERTTYSARIIKHFDLIAYKKSGFPRQKTLISFLGDERNNVDQLLSFLKQGLNRHQQ